MRISTQSFSNNMLLNFQRNQSKLFTVQNQIANQTRILKPSDDPGASTQLAQLRREQAAIDQYQNNIDRLKGNLTLQESSVKGVEQQLLAMQDKLAEAMGGTLSAEEMTGYGRELASMLEATLALANSKDEDGRYLFSGTRTNQQPITFNEESNSWSFQGNRDSATTNVSNGMSVQVTTHLAQAFGDNLETLNQLKAVAEKMQSGELKPAEYAEEMSKAYADLKQSHAEVTAIYTELGGRFSQLTLLKDLHGDNTVANDTVMRNLTELDMAKASIELTGYYTASMASQKSYSQIQQLSLFSLI